MPPPKPSNYTFLSKFPTHYSHNYTYSPTSDGQTSDISPLILYMYLVFLILSSIAIIYYGLKIGMKERGRKERDVKMRRLLPVQQIGEVYRDYEEDKDDGWEVQVVYGGGGREGSF